MPNDDDIDHNDGWVDSSQYDQNSFGGDLMSPFIPNTLSCTNIVFFVFIYKPNANPFVYTLNSLYLNTNI